MRRGPIFTPEYIMNAINESTTLSTEKKSSVYLLLRDFVRGIRSEHEVEADIRILIADDVYAFDLFVMYCFQNAVITV